MTPSQEAERILSSPLPDRYRLVHGLDPANAEHLEAAEAIAVRNALAVIELALLMAHSDPASIGAEETGRLKGMSHALAFWVRTAGRKPSWDLSVALEARDLMWLQGLPLNPEESWEDSLGRLLQLAGGPPFPTPLQSGQRVWVLPFTLDVRLTNPVACALRITDAFRAGMDSQTLAAVTAPSAPVLLEGHKRTVPRQKVLPLGDEHLRGRRKAALRYCLDSLAASDQWGDGDSVDPDAFWTYMREKLASDESIWMGTPAPALR